jgi:hypothetical protein
MRPLRTAATSSQPGRERIVATLTRLPHHDAKMTSGSRLNVNTPRPRRTSSAARSAWRSENASTRSGSSAMIRSKCALVNAEMRGFVRASGGRTA